MKPHINMSDLDALFVSWFRKGHSSGGCFGMFQHCSNFGNNNKARIFVLSKFIIYKTLRLNLNSLSQNNFKLKIALINKGWLCTRLQNQLQYGRALAWENNFWYMIEYK